jgi:RNA polymerase sigma-70 factor (ECF subfamily)
LWDEALIAEAEALLQRASAAGRIGRFQLEAAVQSAHCVRRRTGSADWGAILALYDALHALTGSPVAALNRAVALAAVEGPRAGLEVLDSLSDDARLTEYQPFWAARADLLARCGEREQAIAAYQQAIGLERDPAVRRFLQRRARLTR